MKKHLSEKLICVLSAFVFLFPKAAFAEPAPAADAKAAPEINAKAAVLMEQSTGNILFESNPNEQLPIASVTKIMTLLLICEALDSGELHLDDTVTASERAESMGGSTMFLEVGEQLKVDDMLKGITVASANDGCVAMAEHIAGSEAAFVEMMNSRAKELGMMNTHFVNTNGLDADEHFSSARDVALMSRELLTHKIIFNYTKIWTDELRGGKFQLANTNRLIRFYPGANGLKTGSTSVAGCCISASAERDGMQLIAVILGAPSSNDRFNSAKALLDYGFASYAVKTPVKSGCPAGEAPVQNGVTDNVSGIYTADFSELTSKSGKDEYTVDNVMRDNLQAPISVGDIIGTAEIRRNGEAAGAVDIAACESVDRLSFGDILKSYFTRALNL